MAITDPFNPHMDYDWSGHKTRPQRGDDPGSGGPRPDTHGDGGKDGQPGKPGGKGGGKDTDVGASALVHQFFNGLGLGALADWAWQQSLDGATLNQILALMHTDPFAKPIYDSIYPAYDELAKQGRAMTEGQMMQWEHDFKVQLTDFGVPSGIYDTKEAMAKLMIGNIDLPQIQERLAKAAWLTTNAPAEVRDAYSEFYGAQTNGAIMASYMDPDLSQPALQQRAATANAAGAARANDLQGMDQKFFEDLSKIASEDAVWEAAAKVARERDLYTPLIGEDTTPGLDTGLEAAAGVGAAQKEVARQAAKRSAAFGGGGGLAETDTGVSGLSSAQR